MKYLLGFLLFGITIASQAQTPATPAAPVVPVVPAAPQIYARAATELFAQTTNKIVKNAPFAADAVSERVQVLADGNRIAQTSTTKLARDGEGRFRREEMSNSESSNAGFFSFQETISITDPIAGFRYSINPNTKTVRRSTVQPQLAPGAVYGTTMITPAQAARVQTEINASKTAPEAIAISKSIVIAQPSQMIYNGAPKTESLGTRDFDGVQAEGTRTVTTIAAGAIGNERPIEIVYERWYSKELELIVYSKHNDPRFGEQTYRLTNLSRGEPDRALFTPPADYKSVSDSFVFQVKKS